ncbi:hypothetical protein MTO96_048487 [Rhipicephalus appendiculatus]
MLEMCVRAHVCDRGLCVSELQRRTADTPKAGTQASEEARLCHGTTGRPLVIREGGHVVLAAANCASASVYSSGGTLAAYALGLLVYIYGAAGFAR